LEGGVRKRERGRGCSYLAHPGKVSESMEKKTNGGGHNRITNSSIG